MMHFKFALSFSLLAFLLLAGPSALSAQETGGFGVQMGDPLSKYHVQKKLKPNLYRVEKVPKPHEDFPVYALRHHPSTGVCLVSAAGWPIITNPQGDQLKAEFDVWVERLKKRFGRPRVSFHVVKGSTALWKKHFMSKLVRNEAVLAAQWRYDMGSTMDDQVMEVLLLAKGEHYEEGSFDLQFKFNNYRECLKAQMQDEVVKP